MAYVPHVKSIYHETFGRGSRRLACGNMAVSVIAEKSSYLPRDPVAMVSDLLHYSGCEDGALKYVSVTVGRLRR